MRTKQLDRILGAVAVISVIIAWVIGANLAERDIYPSLQSAVPSANHFTPVNGNYAIMGDETENSLLGYVSIASANGYGGPMKVAVAVDLKGNILGLSLVQHRETPAWIKMIYDSGFIETLSGKSYLDIFKLGEDVDGITGATYTSRAIAQAALEGGRTVAGSQLGLELPAQSVPQIQFGLPEITLIGLYAVGFFGHQQKFKYTKQARWVSMLIGMIVLGFIYTRPLTLSDINKFLLGFWPQWQTNLYWYLLMGGLLFVFTVDNKNPYCEWFCPFGAVQECLGAIGGAKSRSTGQSRNFLLWVQRGLAWLAIFVALLFRNPVLTSYEVFGTLFDLKGSSFQFALLAVVLMASLFIRRPWCNYLCPLRPVTDLYRTFRGWMIDLWKQARAKTNVSPK
jgi:uncharacterized protein with FMN-binding domain